MESNVEDELNKMVKRELCLNSIVNDLVDAEPMIYKQFEDEEKE